MLTFATRVRVHVSGLRLTGQNRARSSNPLTMTWSVSWRPSRMMRKSTSGPVATGTETHGVLVVHVEHIRRSLDRCRWHCRGQYRLISARLGMRTRENPGDINLSGWENARRGSIHASLAALSWLSTKSIWPLCGKPVSLPGAPPAAMGSTNAILRLPFAPHLAVFQHRRFVGIHVAIDRVERDDGGEQRSRRRCCRR